MLADVLVGHPERHLVELLSGDSVGLPMAEHDGALQVRAAVQDVAKVLEVGEGDALKQLKQLEEFVLQRTSSPFYFTGPFLNAFSTLLSILVFLFPVTLALYRMWWQKSSSLMLSPLPLPPRVG